METIINTNKELPDYLYHATPLDKLDNIMAKGITAENSQNFAGEEKPHVCYSPSIRRAIYFVRWVHFGFSTDALIGVIRVDPEKLDAKVKKSFKQDPLDPTSLITPHSISPNSFDFVLLVDISGKDRSLLKQASDLEKRFDLPIIPLNYEVHSGEFDYNEEYGKRKIIIEL